MSFSEFPEQGQAVQLLQRSLERGRLSHAYLFGGGDLKQLEDVARTLAKALNCQSGPGSEVANRIDSCDHCASCLRIDSENHPDIQWIRPESKSRVITIDQMRDLMHTVNLKPTEARWKVAIIVAADRLNAQAANAFLKTLEEPPLRSIILLLSTEPSRIIDTIRSRCLHLNLAGETKPVRDAAVMSWLTEFSEIAAQGQKGLLDRYRLLGSLLAQLNEIKDDTDKRLTRSSPLKRFDDIEPRLRERWEDELTAAIEAEYRRRRSELLLAAQWWLRDIWVLGLQLGHELLSLPTLANAARKVSARISEREALGNIEVLEQTQRLLGSNVQEALALEVGLLKLKL